MATIVVAAVAGAHLPVMRPSLTSAAAPLLPIDLLQNIEDARVIAIDIAPGAIKTSASGCANPTIKSRAGFCSVRAMRRCREHD